MRMRKLKVLALMVLVCVSVWGQEKLNGVVEIDMATSTDNNSPGITVKINDDFLYDGKYLNHYGFGFHDFKDNSSSLNGRNAYLSGYFGIDLFTGGKNRLRLNTNGNVGIGTTSPSEALEVNGNISTKNWYFLENVNSSSNENSRGISWHKPDPENWGIYRTSGSWTQKDYPQLRLAWRTGIQLYTNPDYGKGYVDIQGGGLRVTSGKVGIGTNTINIGNTGVNDLVIGDATRSHGLVVNANANKDGILAFASNGNMVSRFIYSNTTGDLYYYKHDKGHLFTIKDNGNVGIGTTNPGIYKLAVEGIIGAHEIKVTTDGWADFVFDQDYALPQLQEVEAYIQEHKHLPNIPSEQEVKENGIALGDMDAKLLRKIEELTLYAIQQNAEVERQKLKVESLEEERKRETEDRNKETAAREKLEKRLERLEALLLNSEK